MMADQSGIEKEMVFPVEPAEVWAALTDAAQLSAWFGASVDRDLSLGEVVTFRWIDGSSRRAVVEVVDEAKLLVIRWLPFRSDADGRLRPEPSTRVRFLLRSDEHGTRLTVSELGDHDDGMEVTDAVSRVVIEPTQQPPGLLEARGAR